MATVPPNVNHQQFYADVAELLKKHAETLNPLEMLAISAQIVGKVLALQAPTSDKRLLMETISRNIEAGNHEMVQHAQQATKLQ
jgi:hypothetical protein